MYGFIGSLVSEEGERQLALLSKGGREKKKKCKRKYESEKSEESDSGVLASGCPRLPFDSVDPKYIPGRSSSKSYVLPRIFGRVGSIESLSLSLSLG